MLGSRMQNPMECGLAEWAAGPFGAQGHPRFGLTAWAPGSLLGFAQAEIERKS